jgi:hypothetical protein
VEKLAAKLLSMLLLLGWFLLLLLGWSLLLLLLLLPLAPARKPSPSKYAFAARLASPPALEYSAAASPVLITQIFAISS